MFNSPRYEPGQRAPRPTYAPFLPDTQSVSSNNPNQQPTMTTTTPSLEAINAELARRPRAKRIAVENFVLSCPLDGPSARQNAQANLYVDARLYQWNLDTIKAIRNLLSL